MPYDPLQDQTFYGLKPEVQHEVMMQSDPEWGNLSPAARKIVLHDSINALNEKNKAAGLRAYEGPQSNIEGIREAMGGLSEGLGNLVSGTASTIYHGLVGDLPSFEVKRQQDISQRAAQESSPALKAATQLERIPFIGPIGASLGTTAGELTTPQSARALGKFGGEQLLPLAVTEGISKGAGAVGRMRTAKAAARYEPASAVDDIAKALQPETREDLEFIDEAHRAAHHELVNKPTGSDFATEGTEGYLDALKSAQKSLGKQTFEPELQKFGKNIRSVDPVAANIRSTLAEGMGEIRPGLKEAVDNIASKYEGKHWSYNKMFETQQQLRRELDAIDKAPTAERGKPMVEAKRAELKTLTRMLYDDLSSLSGKDFTAARYRYKALERVEDLARKADNKVAVSDAIERATRHPIVGDIVEHGLTKGVLRAGRRISRKYLSPDPNHPNNLIASGLKKLGGKSRLEPIPTAKGQGAIPFSGPGIEQTPTEGQGPLFTSAQEAYRRAAQQAEQASQPGRLSLPPASGSTVLPSSGQKITPPFAPGTPSSNPYTLSMQDYLNLQNISPETQEFLGFRRRTIPPPPEKP